ncbi:hypothetical protein INT45_008121 [Circinella minor]|uniref:Uncharacterized protein n=1 Tax=Circinella minor TaxID=1195481 RepID=A0A8H7RS83_9FUNG|nr:hypothetical protein INT45_008121 [Circinella minor]
MRFTERRLHLNEIKAEEEQRSTHPSSLIHLSDSEYSVVSFNNNAHNALGANNNQVASCTCPDYQRHFPHTTVSTISSPTPQYTDHPQPPTKKDQLHNSINRLVSRATALKRRVNRSAITSNNNNNTTNIIQQIDALIQSILNVDSDLDDILSLPPNSNFELQ